MDAKSFNGSVGGYTALRPLVLVLIQRALREEVAPHGMTLIFRNIKVLVRLVRAA